MLPIKLEIDKIRKALAEAQNPWIEPLVHGTMRCELYAPKNVDTQNPHTQDELYIVSRGTGQFERANEIVDFVTGDILFVPAGVQHRFLNFSDDFETWVVFWGPKGGEANQVDL